MSAAVNPSNQSNDPRIAPLAALLSELQRNMQAENLWSTTPPSDEALNSSAPFCCDRMPLENWIQFIFIPKMKLIIDSNQSLPDFLAIVPIAESQLCPQRHREVMHTLASIDALFVAVD